jgi:hypothetical protein
MADNKEKRILVDQEGNLIFMYAVLIKNQV